MISPDVSVLMAVHNGAAFVGDAVNSVTQQTDISWELVIVDDGSTDDTEQHLLELRDPRIAIRRLDERVGLARALNFGLERCQAEVVIRLDADDRCRTNRLARLNAEMRRRPGLAVLGSAAAVVNWAGDEIGVLRVPVGVQSVRRTLRWRNPIVHSSVAMRRNVIMSLGGYCEEAGRYEDYELWLRTASIGEIDNLDETLVDYRVHDGQISASRASQRGPASVVGQARGRLASSEAKSSSAAGLRQAVWTLRQITRRSIPTTKFGDH